MSSAARLRKCAKRVPLTAIKRKHVIVRLISSQGSLRRDVCPLWVGLRDRTPNCLEKTP